MNFAANEKPFRVSRITTGRLGSAVFVQKHSPPGR